MATQVLDLSLLAMELKDVRAYPAGTSIIMRTAVLPAQFNSMSYLDAASLLSTADDTSLRAVGLWAIARCLDDETNEEWMYKESSLSSLQLCLEALRCDAHCGVAYCLLGYLFEQADLSTIELQDGRTLTERQLYLESIQNDPQYFLAYSNLAVCLSPDEDIVLPDGRTLNKPQLYLEALRCGSKSALVYSNLGACLVVDETVELHDGRVLSERQLYLEALHYNSQYSPAFWNLGMCLSANETVVLHDGRTFSGHQLYLEAIRCDPSAAHLRSRLLHQTPAGQAWTRASHSLLFGTMPVNLLFATLLLALQRLETGGVLPSAHHSMLEDMLEGWTWGDNHDSVEAF